MGPPIKLNDILVVVVAEEVRDDAKNYDNDACNEAERADETVTAKSALRRFYTRPRIKNWKFRLTTKKIYKKSHGRYDGKLMPKWRL